MRRESRTFEVARIMKNQGNQKKIKTIGFSLIQIAKCPGFDYFSADKLLLRYLCGIFNDIISIFESSRVIKLGVSDIFRLSKILQNLEEFSYIDEITVTTLMTSDLSYLTAQDCGYFIKTSVIKIYHCRIVPFLIL